MLITCSVSIRHGSKWTLFVRIIFSLARSIKVKTGRHHLYCKASNHGHMSNRKYMFTSLKIDYSLNE